MTPSASHPFSRFFKHAALIEPHELRAVTLSFFYFFFLLGSYFILRPVRDAMGAAYGAENLEDLYTGTFLGTLIVAPIFAFAASRVRLSVLLPWIYGFIAITIVGFYFWFDAAESDRWVAAGFYVWVSVFNMLITSVFWSFMADLFSRTQAKRLYAFMAAGGSFGALLGPMMTALLVSRVGTQTLLLVSAAGFCVTIILVRALVREKERLRVAGEDPQTTTLDHAIPPPPPAWRWVQKLPGKLAPLVTWFFAIVLSAVRGFTLLFRSPYLLGIALFILFMTWVSTILYVQQVDFIAKAFPTRDARTEAFAWVDVIVNTLTIGIQFFGTGRLVARFGVRAGLILNPLLMIAGFLAVAFSPVLMVLLGAQIIRRVSEYAVARPSREMLFTVVDQESKYKAKNIIDTVVYRFGDLSAVWVQNGLGLLGVGVVGIAMYGVGVCAVWAWVATRLGRRYENATGDHANLRPAHAAAE